MPEDAALERIEQELTLLVRRAMKTRVEVPGRPGQTLERSAYAILARLAQDGPSRLTALAHAFELDLSTVSRQVQALQAGGLVARATDPADRRAVLLTLTPLGRQVVQSCRTRRHERLVTVLDAWPAEDREVFGRLLARFNAGMAAARAGRGEPPGPPPPTPEQPEATTAATEGVL